MSSRRVASHAGSWYAGDAAELQRQVNSYFERAQLPKGMETANVKAVIAPHAGLSYSGFTASHAYKAFKNSLKEAERVFILGPSHRAYLGKSICFSAFTTWETPFCDLYVDTDTVNSLKSEARALRLETGVMNKEDDISEHGIELHLPFVASILKGSATKIVPICCGSVNEAAYGKLFKKYIDDPKSKFIISSDFCHWGSRFGYQYHFEKEKYPNVGDSIIAMDHKAIDLIAKRDLPALDSYMGTTRNTICGIQPISLLLNALVGTDCDVLPLHYSQSNKCRDINDSSVSYASFAVVTAA
eukprot:TRINITY_DN191_c8_g1_i1.p1 TRINITY_DN191_c8_g1~~TRINITY_DN191_c8_g1_i1.p1  ORF type:complete len:315 (+),score=45.48 TRINITY_DN191_c8_g1_i1:46-945(+)